MHAGRQHPAAASVPQQLARQALAWLDGAAVGAASWGDCVADHAKGAVWAFGGAVAGSDVVSYEGTGAEGTAAAVAAVLGIALMQDLHA